MPCKKNNLEKYSSLGAKYVDPQDEREKAWMGMMEEERFTEIDAAVWCIVRHNFTKAFPMTGGRVDLSGREDGQEKGVRVTLGY